MENIIGIVLCLAPQLAETVGILRWVITHAHPDDGQLVFLMPIDRALDGVPAPARHDVEVEALGLVRTGAGIWALLPTLLGVAYMECKLYPEEREEIHARFNAMLGLGGRLPSDREYAAPGADLQLTAEELAFMVDMDEEAAEAAYLPILQAANRLDEALEVLEDA